MLVAAASEMIGEATLGRARAISMDPDAQGAAALDALAAASQVTILRVDRTGRVSYHSARIDRRDSDIGTAVTM